MSSHSDCSPSSLSRRDACSASCFEESKLPEQDDDHSRRGTRLHRLMELMLVGALNLANLPAADAAAVQEAWRMAGLALGDDLLPDGRTANGGLWFSEKRLVAQSTAAQGYNDWGTVDLVVVYPAEKRCVVLDWKFGGHMIDHPKFNLQLQDYMVMVWEWLEEEYAGGASFTMELTYIQPAASEKYNWNPWAFEPSERYRIAARIREIRERAYGDSRNYVVGPQCDFCKAARAGTCWARNQLFAGLVGIIGLTDASALSSDALGRALDSVQIVKRESERLWDMLRDAVREGKIADGWMVGGSGKQLYRKVTERARISEPIHLQRIES